MSLGEQIRKTRKALGMTQAELAGGEFSKSFISQVERDMVHPSLTSLRILAARLRRPLGELLAEEGPTERLDQLYRLAVARLACGDPQAARKAYHEACQAARSLDASSFLAVRLRILEGRLALTAGDALRAAEVLAAAAAQAAAGPAADDAVEALYWEGEAHLAAGHLLRAVRCWERAVARSGGEPPGPGPAVLDAAFVTAWRACQRLADVYAQIQDTLEARLARDRAEALSGGAHDLPGVARRFLELAETSCRQGDGALTRAHAARATLLAQVDLALRSGSQGAGGPPPAPP